MNQHHDQLTIKLRMGSIDTEANELTVNPYGVPSLSTVVTTVTPVG